MVVQFESYHSGTESRSQSCAVKAPHEWEIEDLAQGIIRIERQLAALVQRRLEASLVTAPAQIKSALVQAAPTGDGTESREHSTDSPPSPKEPTESGRFTSSKASVRMSRAGLSYSFGSDGTAGPVDELVERTSAFDYGATKAESEEHEDAILRISSHSNVTGFSIRHVPVSHADKVAVLSRIRSASSARASSLLDLSQGNSAMTVMRALRQRFRKYQDPGNFLFTVADVMGLIILFYEMNLVPFVLAWDIPIEGVLKILTYVSATFWTIDIMLSFLKGFFTDGELQTSLRYIAARYCRTWFLLDGFLVTCDWVNLALMSTGSGNSAKLLRFARIAKAIRLFSVLRLGRLQRVLSDIIEKVLSERGRWWMTVAICGGGTLWTCHAMCCCWFAIGRYAPSDTSMRWLEVPLILSSQEEVLLLDTSTAFQYTTSLHWALAQLALGSMEAVPRSTLERSFTIVGLIIGLLVGTTLVSSLSAAMVDSHLRQKEVSDRMRLLRRYLKENRVTPNLALRIQWQARKRLTEKHLVRWQDVDILEQLPRGMRQALHSEICLPQIRNSSFFSVLLSLDKAAVRTVAFNSVEMQLFRSGDTVFEAGHQAQLAYNVVAGSLDYSVVGDVDKTSVEVGAWLSLAALFVHWRHMGSAATERLCSSAAVHVDRFHSAITEIGVPGTIRAFVAEYCHLFYERLQEAVPGEVNDLSVPGTQIELIVRGMSRQMRQVIAASAMESLKARRHVAFTATSGMLKEVAAGSTAIFVLPDNTVMRVVSVVVLRLERMDGTFLTQVGSYKKGSECSPCCSLPAIKRIDDEPNASALDRLVDTKLVAFRSYIEPAEVDDEGGTLEEAQGGDDWLRQRGGTSTFYSRAKCSLRLREGKWYEEVPLARRKNEDRGREAGRGSEIMGRGVSFNSVAGSRQLGVRHSASNLSESFRDRPVYYIGDRNEGKFYAFLSQCDFDQLSELVEHGKGAEGYKSETAWATTLLPPWDLEEEPTAKFAKIGWGKRKVRNSIIVKEPAIEERPTPMPLFSSELDAPEASGLASPRLGSAGAVTGVLSGATSATSASAVSAASGGDSAQLGDMITKNDLHVRCTAV